MTTEQLVILYENTKTETNGNDDITPIRNIVKSIRKEIMQLQDSLPWPPQPKDLEAEIFTFSNKSSLRMNHF